MHKKRGSKDLQIVSFTALSYRPGTPALEPGETATANSHLMLGSTRIPYHTISYLKLSQ